MTLEQAIDRYSNNAEYERRNGSLYGCIEFRQLAEWLKDYKRLLEQEPCDDAISRDAVNTLVDELARAISDERCHIPQRGRDTGHIMHDILALPSVTQKSGKWVEIDDEPHEVWECDHCGFVIDGSGCIEPYEYRDTYKFCPNCGAKMESEDKE